jgi:hypothetical protein
MVPFILFESNEKLIDHTSVEGLLLPQRADPLLNALVQFRLDYPLLHAIPLQLLHHLATVLQLDLVLLQFVTQLEVLLLQLLVLLEETESLVFKVVHLIVQVIDFVFGILLGNGFVESLDDDAGLLLEFLDLILDDGKHFVLVVLQSTHDVLIDGVDDVMDSFVVHEDHLLRFPNGLLTVILLRFFYLVEKGLRERVLENVVNAHDGIATHARVVLFNGGCPQISHALINIINLCQTIIRPSLLQDTYLVINSEKGLVVFLY